MDCIAVGDESSGPYPDGGWLYAMAFPIVRVDRADEVRAGLRDAVAGLAGVLHYYDLTAKRRLEVVRAVAGLPWEAALVVCQMTSNHRQERARSRILTNALPRLERIEKVTGLVLESRARSDRHDRRTRARLLGSRMITPSFQVRHVNKHEVGDQVLVQVARRLARLRLDGRVCVAARLGGDWLTPPHRRPIWASSWLKPTRPCTEPSAPGGERAVTSRP